MKNKKDGSSSVINSENMAAITCMYHSEIKIKLLIRLS